MSIAYSLSTSSVSDLKDTVPVSLLAGENHRNETLERMLESNRVNQNLEAMKRIILLIASGNDMSGLFACVVKNVSSKNIELKKLVYTYLARYAEVKQDLALLSIASFQRALKEPNQLIRGNALRVLSSIRVPVITPISMLSVTECCQDMSPYVRKCVAHAIPKLYLLDKSLKPELVKIVDKLIADRTTLVIGSALMAYKQVCLENTELLHKHYRRLCNILVDIDEWGQTVALDVLTYYARTQFVDPNLVDVGSPRRAASDQEGDEVFAEIDEYDLCLPTPIDADLRLLLNSALSLLNSRNSAVILSIVQLYIYMAPAAEMHVIVRPLLRLLSSTREVQLIVYRSILCIIGRHQGLFDSFLKHFIVFSSDCKQIKTLKLEIFSRLCCENNVSFILREFHAYLLFDEVDFVVSTIKAIGRSASLISSVTQTCLQVLVAQLSRKNDVIVAESIVVVKYLLQIHASDHTAVLKHLARLLHSVEISLARASIIWLIGEYCELIPKVAPDILRLMAKSFVDEVDLVKYQIVTLAAKLCLTTCSAQSETIAMYVFRLAHYDLNYDVRDRARLLRALVFPDAGANSQLGKYARKILLSKKPSPNIQSTLKNDTDYTLSSLSSYLSREISGYTPLPDFAAQPSHPTVRNVDTPAAATPGGDHDKYICVGSDAANSMQVSGWSDSSTITSSSAGTSSVYSDTDCSSECNFEGSSNEEKSRAVVEEEGNSGQGNQKQSAHALEIGDDKGCDAKHTNQVVTNYRPEQILCFSDED